MTSATALRDGNRPLTSLQYLLDTNVLSEPVKPNPNPHVMRRLQDSRELIATAAPVWNELLYGVRRMADSKRKNELLHYLENVLFPSVPILPYDQKAAGWHANERARLDSEGRRPSFVDGQIAAISYAYGLTLVTANVRDFEAFKDIAVENWAEKA